MSARRAPQSQPPKYPWLLPIVVVIAVGILVWAVVSTVANGTFL